MKKVDKIITVKVIRIFFSEESSKETKKLLKNAKFLAEEEDSPGPDVSSSVLGANFGWCGNSGSSILSLIAERSLRNGH